LAQTLSVVAFVGLQVDATQSPKRVTHMSILESHNEPRGERRGFLMQTIRKTVTKNVWERAVGMKRIELAVELVIDEDAIIERLATRAYRNKSGSASYMRGAVVLYVRLA
jgi:hypothetical protein